jgi:ankyrin repeat protein
MTSHVLYGIDGDEFGLQRQSDSTVSCERGDVIPLESLPFRTPQRSKNLENLCDDSATDIEMQSYYDIIPDGISPASVNQSSRDTDAVKRNYRPSAAPDLREFPTAGRRIHFQLELPKKRSVSQPSIFRDRSSRVLITFLRNCVLRYKIEKFHQCCSTGSLNMIARCLDWNEADYKFVLWKYTGVYRGSRRLSAFHIAAERNNVVALRLLAPTPDVIMNVVDGQNLLHFCAHHSSASEVFQYLIDVVSCFSLQPGQRDLCQPSSNETVMSGYLAVKTRQNFGLLSSFKKRWVTVTNSGLFVRVDEFSRSYFDFFPLIRKRSTVQIHRILQGYVLKVKLVGRIVSTMMGKGKISFFFASSAKERVRKWHRAISMAVESTDLFTMDDEGVGKLVYAEQREHALSALDDSGNSLGHIVMSRIISNGCDNKNVCSRFLWMLKNGVDLNCHDRCGRTVVDILYPFRDKFVVLFEFLTDRGCRRGISLKSVDSSVLNPKDSHEVLNSEFGGPVHQNVDMEMSGDSTRSSLMSEQRIPSRSWGLMLGYTYLNIFFKDITINVGTEIVANLVLHRKLRVEITVFRSQTRSRAGGVPSTVFLAAEKFVRCVSSEQTCGTCQLGFTWTMLMPLECPFLRVKAPTLIMVTDDDDPSYRRWVVVDLRKIVKLTSALSPLRTDKFVLEQGLARFGDQYSSGSPRGADFLNMDVFATRLSGLTEETNQNWFTSPQFIRVSVDVSQVEGKASVRTFGSRHCNPRVENGFVEVHGRGNSVPKIVTLKTLEYVDGDPSESFIARLPSNLEGGTLIRRLGGRPDRTLLIPDGVGLLRSSADCPDDIVDVLVMANI